MSNPADKPPGRHRTTFRLGSNIDAAINRFVSEQFHTADTATKQRTRTIVVFCWLVVLLGTPFTFLYYLAGSKVSAAAVLGGIATVPFILLILRRTGSTWLAGNAVCFVLYASLTVVGTEMGGDRSPSVLWYTIIPIFATGTVGKRSALAWLAIVLVSLAAFGGAGFSGYTGRDGMTPDQHQRVGLLALMGMILFVHVLTLLFESFKNIILRQVQRSEAFERALSEASPDYVFVLDEEGMILQVNHRQPDRHEKEIAGQSIYASIPEDYHDAFKESFLQASGTAQLQSVETALDLPDGRHFFLNRLNPVQLIDEKNTIILYATDITDQKLAEQERAKLEDQLFQSQKLEAVGRLAGGVAHDFNNILTGITGYTEMMQSSLQAGDPMFADMEEVRKAAERAAGLTAQLLAFSRKQIIDPKVIQPNDILADSQKMLERIIGEDIDFVVKPADGLWRIKADPGQLDQVFVNLAVNARDAMPDGGRLTVETRNVKLDEEFCKSRAEIESGDFVLLAVTDSGQGMDAETLEHIFEPFYSTKAKDEGTGLGLSTVYGIMKQNCGFINVYSEPTRGTTFEIYFPAVMEKADKITRPDEVAISGSTETVLLVEDEKMVRHLARRVLEKYGFTVVEQGSGEQAMAYVDKHDDAIDLLLTDVIMPGMNGRELYDKLRERMPGLRVLFMSGYTDNAIGRHCVLDEGIELIQKPFNIEALIRKVRDVLDR